MNQTIRNLLLLCPRGGFRPSDIPGLVLWLAARRIAGKSDGDALTATIADLSPAGNDITPVNSPTFQSGAGDLINGHPVIRTVIASSQYLTANGVALSLTGDDQPATVFLVAKVASVATTQVLWGAGNSGNNTPIWQEMIMTGTPSTLWSTRRDDGGTGPSEGRGTIDTNLHILAWWFNGTTIRIYKDGVQQGTDLAFDANTITLNRFAIAALLRIGAEAYCGMDLAEMTMHGSALSVANMNTMGRWLAKLYAQSWTDIPN